MLSGGGTRVLPPGMFTWAGAVSKHSDRRCTGNVGGPGEPLTRLEGGQLGRLPRQATPEGAVKREEDVGPGTERDGQA